MTTWKQVTENHRQIRGTPKKLLEALRKESEQGQWMKNGFPLRYHAIRGDDIIIIRTEDAGRDGRTCDAVYFINANNWNQCIVDLG